MASSSSTAGKVAMTVDAAAVVVVEQAVDKEAMGEEAMDKAVVLTMAAVVAGPRQSIDKELNVIIVIIITVNFKIFSLKSKIIHY